MGCGRSLGYFSAHSARFGAAKGVTEGDFGTHGGGSGLEDWKEGWEEGEFDAGDGGEAEEAVFDLGEELGVGGVVGAGGAEGDAGEVARGEAGDGGAGCVGVGSEGGGGDEAGVDDVAVVGVAVAEEVEEVGWGHGVSGGTVLLYRFGVVGC